MTLRTQTRPLAALLAAWCVGVLSADASAATFVVTQIGDSGAGSLRQAILDANAASGDDVIQFNLGPIANPPVFVSAQTALPAITGNVRILGPGASQVIVERSQGAAADFPVFQIAGTPTVEISGLTIQRGRAASGAGVFAAGGSLTVRDCVLSENVASGSGGAIAHAGTGGGGLTIDGCSILSNQSGGSGGGVAVSRTGGATSVTLRNTSVSRNVVNSTTPGLTAGGVLVAGTGANTVLIDSCTIADNALTTGGTGGGLHVTATGGSFTVVNSTISGNNAGLGGAMAWAGPAPLVRSCTIHANKSMDTASGGVMVDLTGGGLVMRNTILSGNISAGAFRDLADGQPVAGNNNLVGLGGSLAGAANITGVTDPRLVPMNINGGPTLTFALQPDSPAVDRGSTADAPAVDQRGQPRPADGDNDGVQTADIGAFETQKFVVINSANAGPGSLRQAIADNNLAGGGFVRFAIPGAGTRRTIPLTGALPVVARTVFLDGWSQGGPAYLGPPLVEIDGSAVSGIGLDIQWSDCVVRGLAVNGFRMAPNDGVGVRISSRSGLRNWIYGCYIGLGLDGATDRGNQQLGVWIDSAANANLLGTNGDGVRDAEERNVIAGSRVSGLATGVYVTSNSNVIAGNYVGTDAAGSAAVPNGNGVWVAAGSSNRVGANEFNAVNPAGERNVVSGNANAGVSFTSSGSNNTIAGNYIGVRADGAAALGNLTGVFLDSVEQTLVGGTSPAARNVVSGNSGDGMLISGSGARANLVQGNFVGLNAAGDARIGNGLAGVRLRAGANSTRIGAFGDGGSFEAGRRNVISGNGGRGVQIQDAASTDNRVLGNFIGTNAAGTAAIGNVLGGVGVINAPGAAVGSPGSGGNVIAGTAGSCVEVFGATATGARVQGNRIGVGPLGEALPGGLYGVSVRDGASMALVGGTGAGEGNAVRRSSAAGVRVISDTSLANAILGNSIDASGTLGIDLADDGVTPNAAAGVVRTGPNNLPNYPVISAVTPAGAVTFTLTGKASTSYRVEVFSSPAADATGFGEGRTFLAATAIDTDAAGVAPSTTLGVSIPTGERYITATATELSPGDVIIRGTATPRGAPLGTSEFSLARAVNTAPVANPVAASGVEDQDVVVALSATDPDTDQTIGFTVETLPAAGTLLQFGTLAPITAAGTAVTDAAGRVVLRPAANAFGSPYASFQFRASDGTATSGVATATVAVAPAADTPSVTGATTREDTQSTGGLVISRSPVDGPEVTHYQITGITNGSLFKTDGVTPIVNGQFITVAEGAAGLRFTPAPNSTATGEFKAQASVGNQVSGLGGGLATALITVTPVADTPTITGATTLEDTRSTSGLVVTRASVDGAEVTHFKVTGVTNGSLFLADGVTAVAVGQFITAAQGAAGLRFTPVADFFGNGSVSVQASTSAADAGVGGPAATATVVVVPVNDAPTFAASNPPAIAEDAGAASVSGWAVFSPGPPNEADQSVLAYTVSGVSNPVLFAVPPAVAADGRLTYTPAPNANGTSTFTVVVRDSGGTANGGVDTSSPRTFTITVTSRNDAPTFAASNPPAVLEDSGQASVPGWATFSPGPADEASQTVVGYQVTAVGTTSLFTVQPAISPAGTLTYTPAPDQFGTSTFTVRVQDSGGTANGGVDLSAPQTFTITVLPVNDAPAVLAQNPPASLEDAGPVVVTGWAAFSPGPANESDQTALAYTVAVTGNAGLFAVAPTVDPAGTLRYTAAPDANGAATISVRVRDSGGTAGGGVDTSAPASFTITVAPVNDKPSFTASNPPAVVQGSGPVAVSGFVTGFNPGPADEATQTAAAYVVDAVSNPGLFSTPPSVAASGRLTYTPAPNAYGTSTFGLRVRDSGGTVGGGVDLSDRRTFTVTVRPAAVCRDVTIDARQTCDPRTLTADRLDATPADPAGAGRTVSFSRSLDEPFAIGVSRVRVTVTYADGLTSSCLSTVTVLASDCNNNGVPDSCETGAGGSVDCNGDGIPDDCQCLWDNGRVGPDAAAGTNGQLSHLGGGAPLGFKTAEDFYLPVGQIHRPVSWTGQMLTNTFPALRKARLEFYDDCDGAPAPEPFRVFTNSRIVTTTPAGGGFDLVTYVFEFCGQDFQLEGGRVYWVSLVGLSDNVSPDVSYWATTTPSPDSSRVTGKQPAFRAGLAMPAGQWNNFQFGPWGPASDCCTGCVNMAWRMSGESCKVFWDNGDPDLRSSRGGTLSQVGDLPTKTVDNFTVDPCQDLQVCYVDAVIWTNCNPVQGWVEIYDNDCAEPSSATPIRSATTTLATPLNQTVQYLGQTLSAYRIVFPRLNWTLPKGRTYWISAGAVETGAASTRSLFAFAGGCEQLTCDRVRISPGRLRDPLGVPPEWVETGRDYAFRIGSRLDPVLTAPNQAAGALPLCGLDVNRDGVTDILDVFGFFEAWFAGCP